MTAFDRFEQRLPELMDELASAQVPDYFDDMLRRTARTRQRPAWSSLERWLPMGVIARPSLLPPLPWRTIVILVILGLLVVAGALIVAGSRQQRLPEPFGPARNGSIIYSTSAGDIHAVDPVTGVSHPVVTGTALDSGPVLSRDGTKFLFARTGDGVTNALFVANVDGSAVHQLFEGQFALSSLVDGVRQLDPPPFAWSPDGAQVAVTSTVDDIRKVTIVPIDGSSARTLELGMSASDVSWRPSGHELVFKGVKSETSGATYGLYVVDVAGTGLSPILPANELEFGWRGPSLSPDGTQVAFSRWGSPTASENGIHVLGVDSGVDRVVEFDGYLDTDDYLPQFSPDGKQIAFQRYVATGYQLVVLPATGGGQPVAIGPLQPTGAADPFLTFSPDGTLILATYPADGSSWLLGSDGGREQQVTWPKGQYLSWQRLAP